MTSPIARKEFATIKNSGENYQPDQVQDGLAMMTVGAFETNTHLTTLLDRVAAGEQLVITKHGNPITKLVGAQHIDRARINESFEKLETLRKGTFLGGLSWKQLRDGGRPWAT